MLTRRGKERSLFQLIVLRLFIHYLVEQPDLFISEVIGYRANDGSDEYGNEIEYL